MPAATNTNRTRGRGRRSLSQTSERYRIVPGERESSRHCGCVRREAEVPLSAPATSKASVPSSAQSETGGSQSEMPVAPAEQGPLAKITRFSA
jgi:hypothetical protein